MPPANLPLAHITQNNTFRLSNPPVTSSDSTDWQPIRLALYHEPPCEMAKGIFSQHIICVALNDPVTQSHIGIYPAYSSGLPTFNWYPKADVLLIYLEPRLLQQACTQSFPNHTVELLTPLAPSIDPFIYQIAVALKVAWETDAVGSQHFVDTMANALALHLLYQYCSVKPAAVKPTSKLSQQQLGQVTDYIQANLERTIHLAELASLVNLSTCHFARLFKQATGIAPHQYQIHCRVERAKQLLQEQCLSLADIAYVAGFANQGHFNHHFKQVVGITPKVFLRQS